jgi:hypothetical protein
MINYSDPCHPQYIIHSGSATRKKICTFFNTIGISNQIELIYHSGPNARLLETSYGTRLDDLH